MVLSEIIVTGQLALAINRANTVAFITNTLKNLLILIAYFEQIIKGGYFIVSKLRNLRSLICSVPALVFIFLFICMCTFTFSLKAAEVENKLVVNVDQGKDTISRFIYGHFIEHLGRAIYDGIYVGENSKIPNIDGIRKDIVEALKEIKVPVLRWPGGCFADEYHWMDGIGPKDQRPRRVNTSWGGVIDDNSFGTHEYMKLIELLGCEPYIGANVGTGSPKEMADWIEYLTYDGNSTLADLRRQNGREEPWQIKYWGIGNECWGCGGAMTPEYYADLMRQYSNFCEDLSGNQLYRVASGANSNDYYWTEVLMREQKNRDAFQGVSVHYYARLPEWSAPGSWREMTGVSATNFNEEGWFNILHSALKMDELITKHSAIMDKYDPDKTKGLMVDEWGTWYNVEFGTNPEFLFQQNTLRDAIVASTTLDIFNKHCDRVKMANIAQTVNVLQAMILTKEEQMVKTPTYYVFKMYTVHHDAMKLPTNLTSEDYRYGDESIPALSATASKDANGLIHITMTNLNPNEDLNVIVDLRGFNKNNVTINNSQIITGEKINSYNDFGLPEEVNIKQYYGKSNIPSKTFQITVPAKSIIMLELI